MTSRNEPGLAGRVDSRAGSGLRSWNVALACAAVLASLVPSVTATAAGPRDSRAQPGGWGVRAGFSSAPDQFVLGLHYDAGEPARRLRFMPNVDLGLGDNRTLVTANPDLVYSFPLDISGSIYAGGSFGLVWTSWDGSKDATHANGEQGHEDDSETDLGVAGILGYRGTWSGRTVFLDTKIHITDAYPGVKLMAGMNFER